MKKTLPYIEDYIEFMAGYSTPALFVSSPIQLARYDVTILSSMAAQTMSGVAFTDKQAMLAHKLVVKYRRQLASLGLDIGSHENNAMFRMNTRSVDRVRRITMGESSILIKFPYDPAVIDFIRESSKEVQGQIQFDRQQRTWTAAVTEPRLLWTKKLVDKYQFELDPVAADYIARVEQQMLEPYHIQLIAGSNGFEITNAQQSLVDYIEQELQGLGFENAVRLIDHSSILGFQVQTQVFDQYINSSDSIVRGLLLNKNSHVPFFQHNNLESIVEYASMTNRYPMFVFDPNNDNVDPDHNPVLEKLKNHFGDQLEVVGSRQRKISMNKSCVYLTNWQPSWLIRVPLLLTLNGMMFGPRKQQIVQSSEKVVFCTETVYNH